MTGLGSAVLTINPSSHDTWRECECECVLDYWNEDVGLDEMTGSVWQPESFPRGSLLVLAVFMAVGTVCLLVLF